MIVSEAQDFYDTPYQYELRRLYNSFPCYFFLATLRSHKIQHIAFDDHSWMKLRHRLVMVPLIKMRRITNLFQNFRMYFRNHPYLHQNVLTIIPLWLELIPLLTWIHWLHKYPQSIQHHTPSWIPHLLREV